ncbi:MAG: carboxypeptidase-like regulatory domain-containing protein, partial [Holosporaceae bacterium]|nr:carboxypeptidase-like regulatory domain-containing protein [Holosporaceae bacterium]
VKPHTLVAVGEYKRGALVEISAEGNYVAEGYLYDQGEVPLALVSGYAVNRSDKQAKPVQFFTDNAGKFIITDLNPGEYNVSVNVEGIKDFEIKITESKSRQYMIKLGKIICQEEGENHAVS